MVLDVLEVDVLLEEDVELLLDVSEVEDGLEGEDVELELDVPVAEVVDAVLDVLDVVVIIGGGSWNGVQGSKDMRSLAT